MPQQRRVAIGVAIVWGVFATWIYWWLFTSVFGALLIASEPPVKALLHNGWSTDQIRPYLNGVLDIVCALFYGLIFGVPLGLVAKRSVIIVWVTFVVAFLAALAVRMSLVDSPFENLVSLIYLLTFLATLMFAFVAYRIRSAYANHAAA